MNPSVSKPLGRDLFFSYVPVQPRTLLMELELDERGVGLMGRCWHGIIWRKVDLPQPKTPTTFR